MYETNILQILPKKIFDKNSKTSKETKILFNERYIGLLFTASWCKFCEKYTPTLIEFYELFNKKVYSFEIINICLDNNEEYEKKVPWLIFDNDKYTELLSKTYRINELPSLLIFDSNGNLVDRQGVSTILKKGELSILQWEENSTNKLCDNEKCTCILGNNLKK